MNSFKILYIGDSGEATTSRHRCNALRRLGHDVTLYDPSVSLIAGKFSDVFNFRTGYFFAAKRVYCDIADWINGREVTYDLAWIDSGYLINRECLRKIRKVAGKIVNYNCDDPTGLRDGMRWFVFRKAICDYDLCVVVRRESEVEYPDYGAKKILRVWRSADEVAHARRVITPEIYNEWKSEVAFVGTWMPGRGSFMLELLKAGIPLSIWGARWSKAPEWATIKKCWRGPNLEGVNYAYAIQCAKINLGLLSKGNRDLHTTRTAEIPFLGGVFCAEKTTEHCALFKHGESAFLWENAADCAQLINSIIGNCYALKSIAEAGCSSILKHGMMNEVIANKVLCELFD